MRSEATRSPHTVAEAMRPLQIPGVRFEGSASTDLRGGTVGGGLAKELGEALAMAAGTFALSADIEEGRRSRPSMPRQAQCTDAITGSTLFALTNE